MPAIVTVNVSLTQAPTPITLQGAGAILSLGGTTLTPGSKGLLTQASDLTPLLAGSAAISTLTWSSSVVTVTTAAPHGLTVGEKVPVTIAGAVPVGYNGTYVATVTTTTAFTYNLPGSTPGSETTPGTYTLEDVAELVSQVGSFFGQGIQTAVYVLELGKLDATAGVASLSTWITANPNGISYGNQFYGFYSYLVPRSWDGNAAFLAFLATFEAFNAKTYFFVTTTLGTWQLYTDLMKCVVPLIEAPTYGAWPANVLTALTQAGTGIVTATTTTAHDVVQGDWFTISGMTPAGYNGTFLALEGTTGSTLEYYLGTSPGAETVLGTLVASPYASTGVPSTEFTMATVFQASLSINPDSGQVPPFAFTFLFGVTPFPTQGNSALLASLAAAEISYVGTGAEGGISDTILIYGHTADGNAFNFWYAVDYENINCNLDVSNAVINGSNSKQSPLYLNQQGINTLQGVIANRVSAGISAGLVFGTLIQTELDGPTFAANIADGVYDGYAVVNAIPFAIYYKLNPGQYKIRTYQGYAVNFAPQNGFENITIDLNATQFVG